LRENVNRNKIIWLFSFVVTITAYTSIDMLLIAR
jgi:hypothetical protein